MMIKRELLGTLGALAALGLGCGSNEPQEQSTPTCVGPPTPACILPVNDGSFVRAAVAATDGVSTEKVTDTPRRFCMSGDLAPGPSNSTTWGSVLVLPLTDAAPASPFAASTLGITQVQFTIDPPPPAGLTVAFGQFQRADCLTVPDCLTTTDFFLGNSNGALTIIDDAGTTTASLTSFVQPSWGRARRLGPVRCATRNQTALAAQAEAAGCIVTAAGIIGDDTAPLREAIARLLPDHDAVILSGGSSVGTKDLSAPALAELPARGILFHGIDIRPGKPTLFARAGGKPVIGMPGFPTSR
jgi:molybdenum cofactor synthesis domain-containing protein